MDVNSLPDSAWVRYPVAAKIIDQSVRQVHRFTSDRNPLKGFPKPRRTITPGCVRGYRELNVGQLRRWNERDS